MIADPTEPPSDPASTPDPPAPGVRPWFRAIVAIVLLAALLTCVVLGVYRVVEAMRQPGG